MDDIVTLKARSQPALTSGDYSVFTARYLGRAWSPGDGIPSAQLDAMLAERRTVIPASLRSFYETLGSCAELLELYAVIRVPHALSVEDGWLVFAEENQGIVSWGFPADDLAETDPMVWQRNNEDGRWYDEELQLHGFLSEVFDFAVGNDAPAGM